MPLTTETFPCKYHQHSVAAWECQECDICLCDQCVPFGHSPHWGISGPRCPLCNRELAFLIASDDIQPMWTQIPALIRYPLHKNALLAIGALALLSMLIPLLGLLGWILAILLLAAATRYSFLIIEKRGENEEEAPPLGQMFEGDEEHLFLKMLGALLVLYGGASFLSAGNALAFSILSVVVTLCVPAITIILVIEKQLFSAINPALILSFILRLGLSYPIVWLCYQVVISLPTLIVAAVGDVLPYFLLFPFLMAISAYFWFVASAMLGYTVYEFHEDLGYSENISRPESENIPKAEFIKRKALADANIQMREKNPAAARDIIRPLLDRYTKDKDLHAFYHRVLAVLDDKPALKNHADYFIDFMLEAGDKATAAGVYMDTAAKLPDYQPTSVNAAYVLAQLLFSRGQKQAVVKLLHNIHKLDPQNANIPAAYFLLAKLYSEHMGKDAAADKILDFVLTKFPAASQRREILAYKNSLNIQDEKPKGASF